MHYGQSEIKDLSDPLAARTRATFDLAFLYSDPSDHLIVNAIYIKLS